MRNKLMMLAAMLLVALTVAACNSGSTSKGGLSGAAVPEEPKEPGVVTDPGIGNSPKDPGTQPGQPSGPEQPGNPEKPGEPGGGGVQPAPGNDPGVVTDPGTMTEEQKKEAAAKIDAVTTTTEKVCVIANQTPTQLVQVSTLTMNVKQAKDVEDVLAQVVSKLAPTDAMVGTASALTGGGATTGAPAQEVCTLFEYVKDNMGQNPGSSSAAGVGSSSLTGAAAALASLGSGAQRTRLEYWEAACKGDQACLDDLAKIKDYLTGVCPTIAGCKDAVAGPALFGKAPSSLMEKQGICPVGDCFRITDAEKVVEDVLGVDMSGQGKGGNEGGSGGNAGGGTVGGGGAAGGGEPGKTEPQPAPGGSTDPGSPGIGGGEKPAQPNP